MNWRKAFNTCGRVVMGIFALAAFVWGFMEYDARKADAAEVQQISKDLATLTKLVKEDKLTESLRRTEMEIFKLEKKYANTPMPAAEFDHLMFLKAQLTRLKELSE